MSHDRPVWLGMGWFRERLLRAIFSCKPHPSFKDTSLPPHSAGASAELRDRGHMGQCQVRQSPTSPVEKDGVFRPCALPLAPARGLVSSSAKLPLEICTSEACHSDFPCSHVCGYQKHPCDKPLLRFIEAKPPSRRPPHTMNQTNSCSFLSPPPALISRCQ